MRGEKIMADERMRTGLGLHAVVIAAYLGASLLFTYPLIATLYSHVPGCCDVWSNLWNLWWVGHALTHGQSIYATGLQFHPTGIGLALHTLSLANAFPAILLQELVGLVASYNLLVVFSFAAAGYGMFLLANRVVEDTRAAFVAGLLYAFAPYHFVEVGVGHLNLASIQWIPFYALFLDRLRATPTTLNAVGAAVSLWLTALAEWQYLGFLCLLTAAYVCYWGWMARESITSRTFVKEMGVFAVASTLLIGPFMYPVLAAALGGDGGEGYSEGVWMGTSTAYAASYGAYLLPSHLHPLWGRAIADLPLSGGRVPLGYALLGLAAYGLAGDAILGEWIAGRAARARRLLGRRQALVPVGFTLAAVAAVSYSLFGESLAGMLAMLALSMALIVGYYMLKGRVLGFWPAAVAFFGVLSLGPLLPLPGGDYYPLPYVVFYYLPLFDTFRAPYRFAVIVVLGLCVLAAKGAKRLLSKHAGDRVSVFGFLLCLVVFESLAIPLPVADARVPPVYDGLAPPPDGALLPVPIPPRIHQADEDTAIVYGVPETLYYQTAHKRPIVGGYISRISETPGYAMAPLEGTPLLFHLRHPFEDDIIDQEVWEVGQTVLGDFGIRYVVVDAALYGPGGYPPGSADHAVALLTDVLGKGPDVVWEGTAVFSVSSTLQESKEPYVSLGQGWGPIEEDEHGRFRRIAGPAHVSLRHMNGPVEMRVTVGSGEATTLSVDIDGGEREELSVDEGRTTVSFNVPGDADGFAIQVRGESDIHVWAIGFLPEEENAKATRPP